MTRTQTEAGEFIAPFAALEKELAGRGPGWLGRVREKGLARFVAAGFPTTRDEDWRTTSVAPIARTTFRPPDRAAAAPPELPALANAVPDALRLVFLDGRLLPGLSAPGSGPEGLWAGSLERALQVIPERLEEHLAARDEPDGSVFCALNEAFAEDGGVVLVGDGLELDRPIHLVYLSGAAAEPIASHPRTLVVAGRSSRVRIVESYLGAGDGVCLTNAVTDVIVGQDASVGHYRLQAESEKAFHVSTIRSRQGRDSRYGGFNLNLGGGLVRHDVSAVLDGEGADCDLDGLYLTRGEQHLDHHTTIDHARPRCRSREVYKGVLGDRSRATFRGRIIVRPGAQQTDARQSNPNLLLSDGALAHTRPQLEIYADDVKCTHGATVGRLDEDAIFYLRSRAISDDDARDMLITAFAGEVLERIDIDPLRLEMEQVVARRLPEMRGMKS
jgi:Fe-S cluster assembly protein SufD